MKNEKTKIWPSTLEEAYKAREPHYLVCFREECPLRSSCLHYACGEFVDKEYYFVEAVNPKYPKVATSEWSHLSQERDANDEDGTDEVLQEDDGRAGACRSCQAHQPL